MDAGAQTPTPPTPSAETAHLSIVTSVRSAGPKVPAALIVDVTPKPNIHVYAPEEKDAIAVSLAIAPANGVKVEAPEFPKPEKYFFQPLNLTQLVFSKPFRITQPIVVSASGPVTITGTLRYQACDDKVCYVPKNVPLTWKVPAR